MTACEEWAHIAIGAELPTVELELSQFIGVLVQAKVVVHRAKILCFAVCSIFCHACMHICLCIYYCY